MKLANVNKRIAQQLGDGVIVLHFEPMTRLNVNGKPFQSGEVTWTGTFFDNNKMLSKGLTTDDPDMSWSTWKNFLQFYVNSKIELN